MQPYCQYICCLMLQNSSAPTQQEVIDPAEYCQSSFKGSFGRPHLSLRFVSQEPRLGSMHRARMSTTPILMLRDGLPVYVQISCTRINYICPL